MTKRFFPIDTNVNPFHATNFEKTSTITDPGTGSPVSLTIEIAGSANDALPYGFYSPVGEPNSANWPGGETEGDLYDLQLDVFAAGADLTYGPGSAVGGHFARVDGDVTSDLNAHSPSSNTATGSGIKTFIGSINWSPGAGSASDRFEVLIGADNANMMAQSITVRVNTSNTFFEGPWSAVAPDVRRRTLSINIIRQATTRASLR